MASHKEWLLNFLSDHEPHTGDEIRNRSELQFGRPITVHSRITDLRKDGYEVISKGNGKQYVFRLTGKKESAVTPKKAPVVQGYMFDTAADDKRNGNICQIVERANASDAEVLENGPAFTVKFGDGTTDVVFSSELSPWYPS
jgi:biotin operon repressor